MLMYRKEKEENGFYPLPKTLDICDTDEDFFQFIGGKPLQNERRQPIVEPTVRMN